MGDLTKHFSWDEFACHDGTKVPGEHKENVERLARNLEVLRERVGRPIHVDSGYRSIEHNSRVGGEPHSLRLKGFAADIRVDGMDPLELRRTVENLIHEGKMGPGGLGTYKGQQFIHYDVRGKNARWER
jgi:uncharacterized protein YcbK (DUF882 family)